MTAAVVCLNGGKGSGSEQPNKLSPNDDEILEKRHLDWRFPKFVVMISVGVACKLATLHRPLYVLTLQTHLHEEEQRPLELNPRNQKQLLYLFSAGVFCREPDTTFASMASLQLHCHPFAPFHNCAGGGQLLSLETIRATFVVTLGCCVYFFVLCYSFISSTMSASIPPSCVACWVPPHFFPSPTQDFLSTLGTAVSRQTMWLSCLSCQSPTAPSPFQG